MKTLFKALTTALIWFNSWGLHAQEIWTSPDPNFELQCMRWNFTDVIQVDSTISKDQIYKKVRQWFSTTFVSGKNVIDNEDPDEGLIFGRGSIRISDIDGYVEFNIEVRCKDGRLKYTLSNFNHKGARPINMIGTTPTGPGSNDIYDWGPLTRVEKPNGWLYGYRAGARWEDVKQKAKFETYKMILSLKNSMTVEKFKAADDW